MNDRIRIIEADITQMDVDAIVNAANSALQHGGGVAGAIVAAGGTVIQEESDMIGNVPVGSAAVTGAGRLPCRFVIHAVGPRMGEGDEEAKLRSATRSALERAAEIGAETIAFPAISTGIFGYPVERCAPIMLGETASFLAQHPSIRQVTFCLRGSEAMNAFQAAMEAL